MEQAAILSYNHSACSKFQEGIKELFQKYLLH